MKKFLALLTFVAVLSVTVVGCGDDKKPAKNSGTGTGSGTGTKKS